MKRMTKLHCRDLVIPLILITLYILAGCSSSFRLSGFYYPGCTPDRAGNGEVVLGCYYGVHN